MPKSTSISLNKAIALSLGQSQQPVVTKYQLGVEIFKLYIKRNFQGIPVPLKKESPESSDFHQCIRNLLDTGVITPFPKFKNSVFSILGKQTNLTWEVVCSIDPFAYISHLSAMEYHGFTDRLPKMIFVSSPETKSWKIYANQKMNKDLGEYFSNYDSSRFPKLTRIQFSKIGKDLVHRHSSLHHGAYKNIQGKTLRVSTIGRTFLDMIRAPELCGGIYHIIDVYKNNAAQHLDLITNELERNGTAIDKIRAGYILEEQCNLTSNDTIDSWTKFAQRGGSRKLDITQDYSPEYSPRWRLSINI